MSLHCDLDSGQSETRSRWRHAPLRSLTRLTLLYVHMSNQRCSHKELQILSLDSKATPSFNTKVTCNLSKCLYRWTTWLMLHSIFCKLTAGSDTKLIRLIGLKLEQPPKQHFSPNVIFCSHLWNMVAWQEWRHQHIIKIKKSMLCN